MIYIKFTSSSHYSILVRKTYQALNTYNENNYCQLKMLIIEKKKKKDELHKTYISNLNMLAHFWDFEISKKFGIKDDEF